MSDEPVGFLRNRCDEGPDDCKCWGRVFEAGTRNQHVYPFNDVALHDCDVRCVCGPRWQAVWDPKLSSVVWMWVHASFDGRELRELP